MSVVIIGCGVSGLTSGIRLLEAGHAVTIVTRDLPEQTTSNVAAAYWYPYRAAPRNRVFAWAKRTYQVFQTIAADRESGVVPRVARQYRFTAEGEFPLQEIAEGFRLLRSDELFGEWRSGIEFRVFLAETTFYVPWLRRRFESLGGIIEIATVPPLARAALADLPTALRESDTIVDCAGVFAGDLASDPSVQPVRGQVLRIERPTDMTDDILDSSDDGFLAYIVPRSRDVILGGTIDEGDWSLEPREDHARGIIERCTALFPTLGTPRILGVRVGLRPGRPTVRLEVEQLPSGQRVVHNYGHGGAGFTLSWGCAEEVAELVDARVAASSTPDPTR